MSDHFKDRREFLRIPMASVVQLSLEEKNLGPLTMVELDVEDSKVLDVKLDRDSSPPQLTLDLMVDGEKISRRISLKEGSFVSMRVPLLEDPSADLNMPMVSMIHLDTGKKDSLPAMLVDVSAGGARIMCQFPLFHDDEVVLKVPLPGEEAIELTGRVVWSRQMKLMMEYNFGVEYMVGIRFNEPSSAVKSYIKRHMVK
jgi:hypothetical protein